MGPRFLSWSLFRVFATASWVAIFGLDLRAVDLSPVAESASSVCAAWRLAEKFADANARCEVMLGRGDSMLPLYRDQTVLVVRSVPMGDLRQGMTVVFIGDHGRPVAHTLLEKTAAGWVAIGLGNREPDRTRVRFGNLLGVVVRAYAPSTSDELVAAQ